MILHYVCPALVILFLAGLITLLWAERNAPVLPEDDHGN